MSVRVPENRAVEREGVNAVQAFFERNRCVFQEVAQQNDIGKDAYVDITESGEVTPLCAALQIKAGISYRTPERDYVVPIQGHADNWRRSTVPVFGLVYDPTDQLVRWVDLTGYLRSNPDQQTGNVPVSRHAVLNESDLRTEFVGAVMRYASGGGGAIALNLLSAGPLQVNAVYDAWALGRHDAKYLILLRRLVLDLRETALRHAVRLLAHAGSHPNILWTKKNWIPQHIQDQVVLSFRWSPDELVHMIKAVDPEDYGVGTLGESLDVLMYEDPDIVAKLHVAVGMMLKADLPTATRGATLVLSHSRDGRQALSSLLRDYPSSSDDQIRHTNLHTSLGDRRTLL